MTIKNKAGQANPDPVYGRFTAPGLQFDADGRPFSAKMYTVAFHVADVSSIMIANENFEGWRVSFTDNQGNVIDGRFENPTNSKTFGYVNTSLVLEGAAHPLA